MRQLMALTAVIAVVIALTVAFGFSLSGPTRASHLCVNPPPTPPERGSCGMDAMSIDTNVPGNTNTVIGAIESCASIIINSVQDPGETGVDTITLDITAQDVPPYDDRGTPGPADDIGGLLAYSFNLTYGSGLSVQTHVANQAGLNMILRNMGSGAFIDNDPLPDSDDGFSVSVLDTGGIPESGSGVLSRLTIRAAGTVAPTLVPLTIVDGVHADASGAAYFPDVTNNASIAVNQTCESTPSPSPTPSPTPSPSPPPAPTPTPTDSDGDGWPDAAESAIGTDPLDACADNPADNAWPADIDNNTFVDTADIGAVTNWFGAAAPPAPARANIAPDPPNGFVDTGDLGRMTGLFGVGCGL